jgi:hypothetical protein
MEKTDLILNLLLVATIGILILVAKLLYEAFSLTFLVTGKKRFSLAWQYFGKGFVVLFYPDKVTEIQDLIVQNEEFFPAEEESTQEEPAEEDHLPLAVVEPPKEEPLQPHEDKEDAGSFDFDTFKDYPLAFAERKIKHKRPYFKKILMEKFGVSLGDYKELFEKPLSKIVEEEYVGYDSLYSLFSTYADTATIAVLCANMLVLCMDNTDDISFDFSEQLKKIQEQEYEY